MKQVREVIAHFMLRRSPPPPTIRPQDRPELAEATALVQDIDVSVHLLQASLEGLRVTAEKQRDRE